MGKLRNLSIEPITESFVNFAEPFSCGTHFQNGFSGTMQNGTLVSLPKNAKI